MKQQVLKNLKIWDGLSDAIDPGMDCLVIEGDQIVEVCSSDEARGQGQDMGGLYLTPGLIDAHIHLCLDPAIKDPLEQDKADEADLLVGMRTRARDMLAAGITTARDLGGGQWLELKVRDEIARGDTPGPRLVCSGQPITSVGGHCFFWGGEADSLDTALDVIERQVSHDVDLIKVMATGGNITKGSRPVDSQFDGATLKGIVSRVSELNMHVAAHCHGTEGIAYAAAAGVTTVEHCSWVGNDGWGKNYDDAVASAMANNNVWVSPTINSGWKRFKANDSFVELIHANYDKLKAAGVRLIASTDAGIPNVFHHQLPEAIPVFAFFAKLTPVEALRSATSDCAQAIGLGEKVGRIAPNYSADFLLFEEDPTSNLDVLANPHQVYARGSLV